MCGPDFVIYAPKIKLFLRPFFKQMQQGWLLFLFGQEADVGPFFRNVER